jgi:hypothetical protein
MATDLSDDPILQLQEALYHSDLNAVKRLAEAGANLNYQHRGHDALVDACLGYRDILHDPGLIAMLQWLLDHGVTAQGKADAVHEASDKGRFDAVRLLMQAHADGSGLLFTPLHHSVAFGSVEDVQESLAHGEAATWMEAKDHCLRTPLHIATLCEDPQKINLLASHGADLSAVDEESRTALLLAVEVNCGVATLKALLAAGADVNVMSDEKTVLGLVQGPQAAKCLLDAGANPMFWTAQSQRRVLGIPHDNEEYLGDETRFRCAAADFAAYQRPCFATENGQDVTNPFYLAMIASGLTAYQAAPVVARQQPQEWHRLQLKRDSAPTWCAVRYGQSLNFLPDGRIVCIGGEHEDGYDPDFYIYNDVWIKHPDGRVQVIGYPEAIFPPTDFHSATLVDEWIYIIGGLGYVAQQQTLQTLVFRLHTHTRRMESVVTTGPAPQRIYEHGAMLQDDYMIEITGGKQIEADAEDPQKLRHIQNPERYGLNLVTGMWSLVP